jgi:hypothetical protein
MDAAAAKVALEKLQWDYQLCQSETEGIENATKAKGDLRKLAKMAEELAAALRELGQGALEVMNRRTVRQDLIPDAEPFNLPDGDPHEPGTLMGASEEVNDAYQQEATRGGRWVIRLHALAELARVKAERIGKETHKAGRISFGVRLRGESPEDRLTLACMEFAKAHGCEGQAVVLKLVRAVLEAEHGRGSMTANKGRASVRKLA